MRKNAKRLNTILLLLGSEGDRQFYLVLLPWFLEVYHWNPYQSRTGCMPLRVLTRKSTLEQAVLDRSTQFKALGKLLKQRLQQVGHVVLHDHALSVRRIPWRQSSEPFRVDAETRPKRGYSQVDQRLIWFSVIRHKHPQKFSVLSRQKMR